MRPHFRDRGDFKTHLRKFRIFVTYRFRFLKIYRTFVSHHKQTRFETDKQNINSVSKNEVKRLTVNETQCVEATIKTHYDKYK